ncbi:hypothetical protein ALI144C_10255 [Actinosynnema sp. ALI-1.44]|uniref:hypothetical protein n=1 Tax=Actinosynnema sp. ALI-1.44 TaxID=1933779 RepID=UPI00097C07AB|nr:hypothetical protein [Actinosynnema sp. ALI-1.44]ONI87011.1 hypothetical protein ALI144C_10255 [Actinosynnema sp. ALI-1.44]
MVKARARGSVFSFGVDYTDSPHAHLPAAVVDAKEIDDFFVTWGFSSYESTGELAKATVARITECVEQWVDDVRTRNLSAGVVLYIAGHGRLHGGRHFILTVSSPEEPPYFGTKALSVDSLVQAVLNCGADAGLVLLDTCYAGFAASEIQRALDLVAVNQAVPGMDLAVLVPSLHHQRSYSGLFVREILDSLREGSQGEFWKDGDEYVTILELRDELRIRLDDDQCAYVAGRDGLKILPNPRYRADAADRSAEFRSLLSDLSDDEREHFLLKAASADAVDVGWYFSGRNNVTAEAVEWLRSGDHGLMVVTGAPGAGKSAVLGRLAVLSDPASRQACRALGLLDHPEALLPPPGVFDAIVHVKNQRSDQVARAIAGQLDLDLRESSSPARDLVTELSDSGRAVTILADAVDEALIGEDVFVARDVLRAVAGLPGCKVLVGTRSDRDGRPDLPIEAGRSPLVEALRPRRGTFRVVDLSQDEDADTDIAKYVEDRLAAPELASRWPNALKRRAAALEVSRQSARIFLYARFAMRVLGDLSEECVDDGTLRDRLPRVVGKAGLDQVLADDLGRFEDVQLVEEVLRPLAYARGKGIPRRQVWPELATALAKSGRAYSSSDVSRVIRDAGWYLIEGTESGQSVFRLFHQSVADYFRLGGR